MSPMFLVSYGLQVGQISSLEDLKRQVFSSGVRQYEPLVIDPEIESLVVRPHFSPEDEFYPSRADLKILRTDTIAAIYAVKQMIKLFGLSHEQLQSADLWVATGIFEDRLIYKDSKVVRFLKKAFETDDKDERLRRMYRAIPPMLGLNTLTNATESFVAQYAGIKGRSTTVGNTSASGFYALFKAKQRLTQGQTDLAIAGGANLADTSFFMMWYNYASVPSPMIGVTGGAFLALQAEPTTLEPLAMLTNLHHAFSPADFQFPQTESKLLLVHNPYNYTYRISAYESVIDMYKSIGNLGAISPIVGILSAVSILKDGQSQAVDFLDIDLIGRVSFLTIKSVV